MKFQTSLQNLLDSWMESIVAYSKTEKQGQRDFDREEGKKISNSKLMDRVQERETWLSVRISVNPEAMGNLDMNTFPQVFRTK